MESESNARVSKPHGLEKDQECHSFDIVFHWRHRMFRGSLARVLAAQKSRHVSEAVYQVARGHA
jgi:hypothetical protein